MKMLIGSYDKGIFELEIKNNKFNNLKQINDSEKASYLLNDKPLSYIFNKGNIGYVNINNKEYLLNDTSCHISYDNKNSRHLISHYGSGKLSVIENNNLKQIKHLEKSHIHYASYIETLELTGVVDLGENNFYLLDNNLNIKNTYSFNKNYGPRHFVAHSTLPIIYIITEHIPAVFVLKYEDNEFVLLEKHYLGNGHGSAIRKDNNDTYLYAAVRTSNMIFGFKILKNGLLNIIQKVHSYGEHPRDFNISPNLKYLVCLNMHSNNATLYEIDNGKLYLLENNFYVNAGASVIFIND